MRLAENGLAAARCGAKLTAQLLAFSRRLKLDPVPLDVNALIQGMTPLLSQSLGASIEIRKRLEDNLPPALADAPGKGTGLGLSQVFGVVHQLGGDISIDSKVGEGAVVRIRLRRSEAEPRGVLDDEHALAAPSAERMLVVDDDDVRRAMTGILSEIGYTIRECATGAEALVALPDFNPDLVIVDFAMPGQNGAEIAHIIRQTAPVLPIVFVSGYADDLVLETLGGDAPVLRKPFRPVELAAAVRSALDARSEAETATASGG